MDKAKTFLRDIWRLAKPYWTSEDRLAGLGLLTVIVAMSLGLVFLNVLLNQWNNAFYDTLQNRDLPGFTRQLGKFCVLAAIFILVAVYQMYLRLMLQIRWRRWLTDRFLDLWLTHRVFYALQMRGGQTDNPDQRIADDIDQFVSQTLTLTLGFLEAVVTLVSFVGILWGLSGTMSFSALGREFTVPGYMVWVALGYSIVGTWLTKWLGRPLIRLNYQQQRFEADFRFSLVRLRENVEGVALYRGEADEAKVFRQRFASVVGNWWEIMKWRKRLSWLTNGYSQAAVIFPFLATAPRYFAGAIQLGDMMQTASAFGHVQGSLSWFVDAYTELAAWKATVDRLTTFTRAMDEARGGQAEPLALVPAPGADEALRIRGLSLALPEGGLLLEGLDLDVRPGERLLISGPSGSGKSTLIRAIAGIWPHGRGSIALPASGRLLFLPQKPYLPIGALRAVVSYPTPAGGFTDEAIREALAACGLGRLAGLLDDDRYWAQQLSPGEQQRLAFARMLLQKPDWLFLDEATSAVDEAGEAELYHLLARRLPQAAIISVGHRMSLVAAHQRHLELRPQPGAAGRLVPAV
jgi:putative ATP-binding cassette transporter